MSRARRRRRFEWDTGYDLAGLDHRQARRVMRRAPAPDWLVFRKMVHDGIIWGATERRDPFISWWLTRREATAWSWEEWRRAQRRVREAGHPGDRA